MTVTYLITGASRGLGLGLTQQLLQNKEDAFVVVTSRSKSSTLDDLAKQFPGRVLWVELDTSSEDSIKAAAKAVEGKLPGEGGLDVLINNAGVAGDDQELSALETTKQHVLDTFAVNVAGPLLVTQAFLPLIRKGGKKTIVNMSSGLASIAQTHESAKGGGHYQAMSVRNLTYRQSKAALNMQTAVLANTLREEGIIVISLAPGWVATDMGSNTAKIMKTDAKPTYDVETSCRHQLEVIHGLTPADSGLFKDLHGKVTPY